MTRFSCLGHIHRGENHIVPRTRLLLHKQLVPSTITAPKPHNDNRKAVIFARKTSMPGYQRGKIINHCQLLSSQCIYSDGSKINIPNISLVYRIHTHTSNKKVWDWNNQRSIDFFSDPVCGSKITCQSWIEFSRSIRNKNRKHKSSWHKMFCKPKRIQNVIVQRRK